MKSDDYCDRLHDFKITCGMNSRYHHTLQRRWGVADKSVRIAVGFLSVAGLVTTLPGGGVTDPSVWFAILSVIAAVALNVLPLSEWEQKHADLFRRWTELRKDAMLLEARACDLPEDGSANKGSTERLLELTERQHALDAAEPAPIRELLLQAQGDEIESQLGPHVRREWERMQKAISGAAAVGSGLPDDAGEAR